jgi:ATP-binding cassette, subfamily B, multidrug efflux pump
MWSWATLPCRQRSVAGHRCLRARSLRTCDASAAKSTGANGIARVRRQHGSTGHDEALLVGASGIVRKECAPSPGQLRRQIAIARVILTGAPILVLDEATSALDRDVEAMIQTNLANLPGRKTVITIAHRLPTIAHVDRIAVMRQGHIVEQGTHDDLLRLNRYYGALLRHTSDLGGNRSVSTRK